MDVYERIGLNISSAHIMYICACICLDSLRIPVGFRARPFLRLSSLPT